VKSFFEKQPDWLVRIIVEGVVLYLVDHVDAYFSGITKLLKSIQWQNLLLLFSTLLSYLYKPIGFTLFFFPLVLLMGFILFLGYVPDKWVENYKWAGKLVRFGIKAGLIEPVNGAGVKIIFT
jgi:hypothetical protein